MLILALMATLTPGGATPGPVPPLVPLPTPSVTATSPDPTPADPLPTVTPTPPRPVPPPKAPGPVKGKVIHLTFDDGPDPRSTPQVLRLLRERGAKATFFVVGQQAAAHPQLVAQIRAEGHAVGNHTWSHPQLPKLSAEAITHELARTDRVLGGKRACMRPPYGAHDASVDAVIHARGQRIVMWDIDPTDWARPGADAIARRVLSQSRPGRIVLMHDGGGDRSQSVEATRRIMDELGAQGYRFVPVPGC